LGARLRAVQLKKRAFFNSVPELPKTVDKHPVLVICLTEVFEVLEEHMHSTRRILIMALLLIGIAALLPAQEEKRKGTLRLKLSDQSVIAIAFVFVNNENSGEIKRDRIMELNLNIGEQYWIVVKRKWEGKLYTWEKYFKLGKDGEELIALPVLVEE
jgi:hypothetical protein